MLGWYFSNNEETLRFGDGRKIVVGATHTIEGDPILCEHGLHASKTVYDALQYAPGPILWRVRLGGIIVHGGDKSAGTERTYLARLDATDLLRRFARSCASDVLHMWDAPEVVRRYLATGDESMRAEARDAAGDAARAAAGAAQDAAWAARAAAWAARNAAGAARHAARAAQDAERAAQDAERTAQYAAGAAWNAAGAAQDAAGAARDAAWSAQYAVRTALVVWAARDAARDAAQDAAIAKQSRRLAAMVAAAMRV